MWLLLAVAAAFCFGLRGILYQFTSRKPLNRHVLLLGVYLSGMAISAAAGLLTRQPWSASCLAGLFMGLFSYGANVSLFKAFSVGKASLVAILTSLPAVVVVGLSYLLWKESLTGGQWLSFVILLSGILTIRYAGGVTRHELKGAQWALLAVLCFGLTDVSSKQAMLWGAETLPTLTVMYATGSLLFGGNWYLEGRLRALRERVHGYKAEVSAAGEANAGREPAAALSSEKVDEAAGNANGLPKVPWTYRRTLVWGMGIGISNVSGMIFILPAFRLGITGLVSAVVAMNVLLLLLYARLFLRETFSRQETAGMALTLGGILLLRLVG